MRLVRAELGVDKLIRLKVIVPEDIAPRAVRILREAGYRLAITHWEEGVLNVTFAASVKGIDQGTLNRLVQL